LIDDKLQGFDDINNYILSEEERASLTTSPYIKKTDFRFDLSGKINGLHRMVTTNYDFSSDFYFKGHVLSGKEDEKNENWVLKVSIDEVYFPNAISSNMIELSIPAIDKAFDYEKLLSGASYLFASISINKGYSSKLTGQLSTIPLSAVLIPEDESALSHNYEYTLTMAKGLSFAGDIFPMTYTEDLLSVPDFFNGIAAITKGRPFNQQEYENGSKACVISQELAAMEAISIGDMIHISVTDYIPFIDFRSGCRFDPSYDLNTRTYLPEEFYTVIGFYKTKNSNLNDPQYFNNNTIFVPLKSCPTQLSPESSPIVYYTFKTSFVLSSPDKKYELLEDLKARNFNFDKFNITVYDQGYEQIRMILKNMMDSSISLLLICAVTIILVLALLVYLYLIRRKREFALMRVMGETKHKASLIFYLGILLIGILGTLIAGVLAGIISENQVKRVYETGQQTVMEEGFEGGAYSDSYVFDSEISLNYLLLPILGVFIVLLMFCLFGYLQFRKKSLLQFISERAGT
jgi:ABC-type antimicrobial peptide transport system permease subunit